MKKALTIWIPDDAVLAGTVGDLYLKKKDEESFQHYRIGGDMLAKNKEYYIPFDDGCIEVVRNHGRRKA